MSSVPGILALDTARATGWAALRPDGSLASGTKVLGPEDMRVGPLLHNYGDWLKCRIIEHQPAWIFYEKPWVGKLTHQATALMLMSLAGVTEMVGFRQRVMVRAVKNPSVVKHFTGQGRVKLPAVGSTKARWESRPERKARVMAMCLARGWKPETQDEADALGILDYARHCLGETTSSRLFRRPAVAPWPLGQEAP